MKEVQWHMEKKDEDIVVRVSALSFRQLWITAGSHVVHLGSCSWLGDRKDIRPVSKPVPLIPKVLFQKKWRKKIEEEPANPGSRGKGNCSF